MFRIKEIRTEKGLSSSALATLSGVSRTTIYWLENNIKDCTTTKTLLAIARALDCEIGDLYLSE